MLAGWQWLYFDTLDAVQQGVESGKMTPRDRQSCAVTMGIASEKTLLLSGQPTAIIGNLHEHRHQLPEILARLLSVNQRVGKTPPVVIEASDHGVVTANHVE